MVNPFLILDDDDEDEEGEEGEAFFNICKNRVSKKIKIWSSQFGRRSSSVKEFIGQSIFCLFFNWYICVQRKIIELKFFFILWLRKPFKHALVSKARRRCRPAATTSCTSSPFPGNSSLPLFLPQVDPIFLSIFLSVCPSINQSIYLYFPQ